MKAIFLDGPLEDSYGFARRFREMSNEQLVEAFNREVGNPGWVSARANYLAHLRGEFLSRDLDCASFIHGDKMIMDYHVEIVGMMVKVAKSSKK